MNLLTDTANGPRVLTPHEAQQRIAQLVLARDSSPSERMRAAIQREIDGLRRVANPELAYEGWT